MNILVLRRHCSLLYVAVLIFFLVSESFYFYSSKLEGLSKATGELEAATVRTGSAENTLSIDVSFSLRYHVTFRSNIKVFSIVIFPRASDFKDIVYVYYDDRFPSSGLGLREWIGLKDHIPIELERIGFASKIVDADELKDLMLHEKYATVVIPSGVLPDTVYSRDDALVSNWLENGGVLFWIGDTFGYYVGHRDGTLEFVGNSGQRELLGYEFDVGNSTYWDAVADSWTGFASGLSLSYPHAWVGPSVESVRDHGGLVLGGIYRSQSGEEYSSITLLQSSRGSGRVIIFGGGIGYAASILGEDFAARDMARILWSRIPFSQLIPDFTERRARSCPTPAVGYLSYQIEGDGTIQDVLHMNQMDPPYREGEVLVLAFSSSPYTELFVDQQTHFNFDRI